ECGHDCPENPKLHLRHCGVLRRPNTTTSHYKTFHVSSLAQSLRQFGDIRRNPSRLIAHARLPCEPSYYPKRRATSSPDNVSTIAAARPPVTTRNTSSLVV